MRDISMFTFLVITTTIAVKNAVSLNIKNVSGTNVNTSERVPKGYFPVPLFTLQKCHCSSNYIWNNEKCVYSETGIEFIVSFSPILTKSINMSHFQDVIVQKNICPPQTISTTVRNVAFTLNKTLFHLESSETFSDFYCVEHVKNSKDEIILVANVCLNNFNVSVCCPNSNLFNSSIKQCEKQSAAEFSPQVYLASTALSLPKISSHVQRFPSCNPDYYEILRVSIESRLTLQYQNSTIILFEWEGSPFTSSPTWIYLPQDYCIIVEKDKENITYSALVWNNDFLNRCSDDPPGLQKDLDQCDRIMTWLQLILLSLSSVFLLVILVLHIAMPELRKSLGSKITICHVASLFCCFCLLLLLHDPHNQKFETSFNCKIYGPLLQITFLATYFWLNVMCFDIWWKLRCRSPAGETIESCKIQFVRYSFYAWGMPLIVGLVTIATDNIPSLQNLPWIIAPGFGQNLHCWFLDTNAELLYYSGIIGVLMVANTFFFLWVFVILFKANCTYNKVLKNNKKSSQRTWVYLKIFGVMGITWVCEFLSWKEDICQYWVITDIINSLRGLILFIIFFGNKKSVNKIRQRFSTMNQSLHNQVSISVNSLRNFSRKAPPGGTVETVVESHKTSEVNSEISNRETNHENKD